MEALDRQVQLMKEMLEFDRISGRDKIIRRYEKIDRDITRLKTETQQERPREKPLLKSYTDRCEAAPATRQEAPRSQSSDVGIEDRIESLDEKIRTLRECSPLSHEFSSGRQAGDLEISESTYPSQELKEKALQAFEKAEKELRENPPSPEELREIDAFIESVASEIEFMGKIEGLERRVEELKLSPVDEAELGVRLEELEREVEKLAENTPTLEEKDVDSSHPKIGGQEGETITPYSDIEAEREFRENPPTPEEIKEAEVHIDSIKRRMIDWEEDSGEGWSEGGFSG